MLEFAIVFSMIAFFGMSIYTLKSRSCISNNFLFTESKNKKTSFAESLYVVSILGLGVSSSYLFMIMTLSFILP